MSGRRLIRSVSLATLLLSLSLICGFVAAGEHGWYEDRDFVCLYVAARIVVTGGDPYDVRQFRPTAEAIALTSPDRAIHRCGERLKYPPWVGLALAPFGALPLPTAATLWASLAVLSVVIGINWTWLLVGRDRIPWPLVAVLVVGTEPFVRTLMEGQFGAFSFALTAAAALALRSGRDFSGGVATAGLVLKPSTSVGFVAAILGLALLRRRWRFLGAAAAAGLALAGVSELIRPGWLLDFARAATEIGGSVTDRATIWNLTGSWTPAVAIVALLLAAVVVLVGRQRPNDADVLGLAVAFSLVVSPYAWSHDYVVLAVPWSMTIAHARQLRPLLRRTLMFSTILVAAPLLWIMAALIQVRQDENLSVLVPMLTALLLAFAIRLASGAEHGRRLGS